MSLYSTEYVILTNPVEIMLTHYRKGRNLESCFFIC
jgi:hypothetical protein